VGPKAVEKTPVKFTKTIFLFVILAALFASGLAVRRAVLAAQYERYGRPLPFDLESALNFRYVRMLRESGSLPVVDKRVQYPAGVVVRQTYQTGTEFICAFLARFFPAGVPLDERVRWISAAWFCLGIPALALWIWWWQGSLWGAVLAGSYYALSLAGVIRSTGEELSHENFALPLLVFQFAVSALADREKARLVRFVCLSGLSAILLACALMIWDLIQYYVMIWALLGFIRAVRGEYYMESRRLLKWGLALAALLLAGVFNPYLRAHGFIFSPAMLLAYGAALAVLVARWQGKENAINIKKAGPDCQSGRKDGATGCRAPDLCSGRSLERQVCRKPGSKQKIAVLLRLTIAFLPLVAGYFLCRAYLQYRFLGGLIARIVKESVLGLDFSLFQKPSGYFCAGRRGFCCGCFFIARSDDAENTVLRITPEQYEPARSHGIELKHPGRGRRRRVKGVDKISHLRLRENIREFAKRIYVKRRTVPVSP
jgi:hypothetical protein